MESQIIVDLFMNLRGPQSGHMIWTQNATLGSGRVHLVTEAAINIHTVCTSSQ